jgi:Protein of unknown function (DUF3684)
VSDVETSVGLNVYSAYVDVEVDQKLKNNLHRSTQKYPQKNLRYDLIYVSANILIEVSHEILNSILFTFRLQKMRTTSAGGKKENYPPPKVCFKD